MSEDKSRNPFFSTQELAKRWKISPKTLMNMRYSKTGPNYINTTFTKVLYSLEEIEEYEKNVFQHVTIKKGGFCVYSK